MTATVALYSHQIARPSATGIHKYVRRLVGAVAASQVEGIEYVTGASSGEREFDAGEWPMPVLRPRIPRKALHLAWGLTGRPKVDRALHRPDLVHILYPGGPVPSKAPAVYTIHDLFPIRFPDWYQPRERWLFRRSIDDALDRSPRMIANSETTASDMVARLGVDRQRITVVPMGVDDEFFTAPDPDEARKVCASYGVQPGRYLIVIGTISTRKNLRPVLEALADQSDGEAMTLLAAGPPGIGSEETQHLVDRLGLRSRVLFPGWVPSLDLLALLSCSAALVHPSVEEGFGMTPLEAMAAGVPAVVSNAGALPEVVGDAGLMADPGDPGAWGELIDQVCLDEGLRSDLIGRGRERAARFTWARIAHDTISVHRQVLDRT